ncbi:MAG: T9SS type A sorting domain-containing protein [Bacteroidota bacterium]
MKHKLLLQIITVSLLATALYVSPALSQWSSDPTVNTPICTATGDQNWVQICSDGSGGAIMTWSDLRNGHSAVYAQRVNASGYTQWPTDGVAIIDTTGARGPDIVPDGSGGAVIAWFDSRSGTYKVYAQRVNANGNPQWVAGGVACAPDMSAMVSDGSGGAIIVWEEEYATMLWVQHINGSGDIQWGLDGGIIYPNGTQNDPPKSLSPVAIPDGLGGAIITWMDEDGPYDNAIYAGRVTGSGIAPWGDMGYIVISDSGGYPTIASDGSGGAIIAWEDYHAGDIFAQRVDSSGTVKWAARGVGICEATGTQEFIHSASDGSGGAIIAWCDLRSGYDIYAQRVNASGIVQWTTDGVAICTGWAESAPPIASDSSGGAFISWQVKNSGQYDIYAQHVNASGTLWYPDAGVAVCTATGNQGCSSIVADGSGGAIFPWADSRSGNTDIYAQHVGADGSLPIQLASLTATTLTTGVQLEWTTMSETNSQGFYVERRPKNTGAYITVSGLIPGAGTSLEEHHYQWTDTKVTNGNYNYRLKLVDLDGSYKYSNAIVVAASGVLGADDPKLLPTEFALRQNYPNPFNPTTVINYELPKAVYVHLTVYDMLGRRVTTLVNGAQEAGYKSVEFGAANLPSGIYTYRLTARPTDGGQAGTFVSVKKMLMIK